MKLKSIQLVGFKSFAERTTIDFQNGLTAIVGPNGSGKSNVIEAIRWVLGEQSAKHLRSSKMADVIFSGSTTKRAVNRAVVTLTFDNTDHYLNSEYTEISITRKLFRNGDSFYYLNHQECRLKDINDLLMDSGIGLGSFSIISQGNVEAIFNSKPTERRNIVETTAGIFKYRQKRAQADRQLATVSEDLTRVFDIVSEVQTQAETLEAQSNRAKQYQKYQQHLNQFEQIGLAAKARQLVADYRSQVTQLTATQQSVAELSAKLRGLRENRQAGQAAVERLNQQSDALKQAVADGEAQLIKLKGTRELAAQQSAFQGQQLKAVTAQLTHLTSDANELAAKRDGLKQAQAKLKTTVAELKRAVQNDAVAELEQRIAGQANQIERLRDEYLTLLQQTSDAKNQLTYTNKTAHQTDTQAQAIQDRLTTIDERVKQFQSEQTKLRTQRDHVKDQLGAAKAAQRTAAEANLQAKRALDKHQTQWYAALKHLEGQRATLNGAVEFDRQHGGYYQGSKHLLANAETIDGIVGAVGDLFNVDAQAVQAIEAALGNRVQQIVMRDAKSAKLAIQYLTTYRLGRVTLLPIPDLTPHHLSAKQLQTVTAQPGFVAVATDVVQVAKAVQPVLAHLLGNVVIAKDLSAAIAISRKCERRLKVVTLTGSIVNAGGAITGGADAKRGHGILAQREQLTQLKAQVQTATAKAEQLEAAVQSDQRQVAKTQSRVDEAAAQAGPFDQQVQLAEAKLAQLDANVAEQQRLAASQRVILANLTETATDPAAIAKRLTALEHRGQAREAQIKAAKETLADLQAQRTEKATRLQEHRERLAVQQANLAHGAAQLKDVAQRLAANQKVQQQLKAQQQRLNAPKQYDGTQLTAQINALAQRLAKDQDRLKAVAAELAQAQQQLAPSNAAADAAQDRLFKAQQTLDQRRRHREALMEQLVLVKRSARHDHQLSFKRLLTVASAEPTAQLNQRMASVKEQLAALGPVNLAAIEQFEEVNQRYQFLKQQVEDLTNAKQELTKSMDQMDTTVKKRFADTFNQLNQAFQTTFQHIFGGGNAKLTLTDERHLLTTGIEIMAQPPGKRFRDMALLSGGERSLTAIALLFAVLKLRPVPFCILDEAESALDPANVDRFARYIERLKDTTQFIVITHRKETMVYADQLYGVTMHNSGVSKILSVNLKQPKKG